MPRKKKPTEGLDSRGQDGEEEEEEKRGTINAKKKRSFVDAFIVISDSDGEESKEESGLQKKRTKQQLDRTKFAAKRKIAQMTEEEQFALALKMSEQEARQVNCQEEEEEELLRKAIAESLNSCQPSDSSDATPELPAEAVGRPGQNHPAEQEGSEILGGLPLCPDTPRSECSSHSQSARADGNGQMDVARSPLVVLRRLSQEIVESSLVSSIIVSRGKDQPLTRSSEKPSSPAKSDSSSMLPSTLGEDLISLSPTFGRVTSGSWRLTPRRLFTSPCSPSKAAGHEAKEQPLPGTGPLVGEAGAGSSAVLWKTWTMEQCDSPGRSCGEASTKHTWQPRPGTGVCVSTEQAEQNEGPDSAPELCVLSVPEESRSKEEARDTVHYYWGIPFCPKGVDPNQYTKVILCQLEVYQKSLKQAQRQLLHKKEFGNPVVPSCSSLSQNELGKGDQISRENGVTDDTEDGDSEVQKESESITWLLPSKKREAGESPGQNVEEEKSSASDDEPTTSYCQVSQVLAAEAVPEDGEPMQITQSISVLTPLGSKRSPDIATENSAEEEVTVCPETQPSPSEDIEPEREELCSDSKDAPMQAGGDENAGRTVSECSPAAADRVSCPLCDQGFPATEIELHAMYCNGIMGEEAGEDTPVLTRRQREARNKAVSGESGPMSLDIDKCEKCYLCKSLVPLLQYQRHVDSCLQAARQAQGTRRLRSAKDFGRHEGRLLSMLEFSESKSAGADAGTALSGLGDRQSPPAFSSRAEDEAEDSPRSPLHVPFSISPAKSRVSVSEATDCLVDLEPHLALRLGSRQQTKACRRRKRKF
ncbi:BRCA1-A complex subunit RAP80 isoform X2 [Struthio camelus]|uniref:BRCA1-A complex subunit RAP80 isoform X2 n=1 Tax=Struthio camelus TaxID=8801 RepID=UPI00051E57AE|nr:PREDICTED: BRCA1-A complex subunit RAP80 isoform X2 [Struthio camelus australis]